MKFPLLLVFAALSASAQTNLVAPTNRPGTFQIQTNQEFSLAQRHEKARVDCIQARRIICGKIIKVLPAGLVVDSGYTNLLRSPLNESWLIPGTVTATRAENMVEASQPDAVCVGLVFVADVPKSKGVKPKVYDYVHLEGFPVGQYTYASVGGIKRTVRQFTTKLQNATQWNFEQGGQQNAPPK
jgi:hypothetical protein